MCVRLVALSLLTLAGCADEPAGGPAVLVASLVQEYDLGFFGGISGVDLGPGGQEITLVLDSGLLIRGILHRDDDGVPTGLRRWQLIPIVEPDDVTLGARGLDAEGVTETDAGTFVSFERIHAVWRIGADGKVVERLPGHPDFDDLRANASFEALAADADGALYVVPERGRSRRSPFPVWRYSDGAWAHAFDLPRRGQFLAVGADFGSDGRMYLLERRFRPPLGFATRVRRFTVIGSTVVEDETVLETGIGTHGNLEGLAVWEDAEGSVRLTMVSDDNYSWFQETEIVEYVLPRGLDGWAATR
jgi:hypothetical protein